LIGPAAASGLESGADDFHRQPVDVRPAGAAALLSGLAGDARLNYTARDDVKPSGLPQEASE